ncbi:MAG: dihydrodipicolinate synthase family protein [Treponema sp.]|jgi:4-hydroxy-tetrahydrodipicolinate synthase|nr:dihydrodipicolinate synthase family protein [Treponema sp.]
MAAKQGGTMKGIFTIPSTPFNEDLSIDIPGFRNMVQFCIDCKAHGLVYPVNASEFTNLSDEERMILAKEMVTVTAGKIPTVIGVAASTKQNAMKFAAHARETGASAVIAMPPYVRVRPFSEDVIFDYYQGISDAAQIPVFIQNYVPPVGTDMSPEFLLRLCREIEWVQYIKEETIPSTLKMQNLFDANDGSCKGVFGGSGCRYLIEEYRRGSCGNMPGCHVTDVCVAMWDALEKGDNKKAMQIYKDMAPLFFYETQLPGTYKEVLKRRGIIKCSASRNTGNKTNDSISSGYLDEALAILKPYMTVV